MIYFVAKKLLCSIPNMDTPELDGLPGAQLGQNMSSNTQRGPGDNCILNWSLANVLWATMQHRVSLMIPVACETSGQIGASTKQITKTLASEVAHTPYWDWQQSANKTKLIFSIKIQGSNAVRIMKDRHPSSTFLQKRTLTDWQKTSFNVLKILKCLSKRWERLRMQSILIITGRLAWQGDKKFPTNNTSISPHKKLWFWAENTFQLKDDV